MTITEALIILIGHGRAHSDTEETYPVPQEMRDEANNLLTDARDKLVRDFQGRSLMETLPPAMLEALVAIRDGGNVTRAQILWLRINGYLDKDGHTFTIKGAGQLHLIDDAGGGGSTPGSNLR